MSTRVWLEDYLDSMNFIIREILGRRDPKLRSDLIMMEVGMGEFRDWLLASAFLVDSKTVLCLEKNKKLREIKKDIVKPVENEEIKRCLEKIEFLIADIRKPPLRNVFDIIYCYRLISSEFELSTREEIKDMVDSMISLLCLKTSERPAGQLLIMEYCDEPHNEAQKNFLDWWELRNKVWKMRAEKEWPILSMEDIQSFFKDIKHEKCEADFHMKPSELSTKELEEKAREVEGDCRRYGLERLESVGIKAGMLDGIKKDMEDLKARIEKSGVEFPPYNIIVACSS